ncbi:head maturation protease, ClpP-related [Castellaniella hirudinis]|uniref:head maturation protease, ClpP-related n=1 Tax=Castellaniella hirudinis TaxID=1144617 RepID=UPI0039C1946B
MKTLKLLQLARENAGASLPLRLEAQSGEPSLYLHGVIGGFWGDIDETEFAKTLAGLTAQTIHLRIDSPGGDVFAARSMMTAIAQHPARIIAHVDGLAASAATGLCMACDEVEMSQGAGFMIHNAWTVVIGNKDDLIDAAGLLEKIDVGLAHDYARRTDKATGEITAWMDAETWFTADEAREAGFVDRVVEIVGKRTANAWNLSAYRNAPKAPMAQAASNSACDAALLSHRAAIERHFTLFERMPA